MNTLIRDFWLEAGMFDTPVGPPTSTPGTPGDPMAQQPAGAQPGQDPNQGQPGPEGGQDPNAQPPEQEDVSQDPEHPDMGDDVDDDSKHFEEWKADFFKESIKGNANLLIEMLNHVRDRDLEPDERRFVENNIQIQYLRLLSNVQEASKDIRKSVNDQLDKNNPSTSLAQIISEALEKQPLLVQNFFKINAYGPMKGDLHRKYLAALMGAVQVGSGAQQPDIVLEDNDYAVNISTRMNAAFGNIDIGRWALHENDPQRYLEDAERKRLENGSPEERETLRRRIVMESISQHYKDRAFLITVMGKDGTVYNIGWDIETCLRAAYIEGKLVVRTKVSGDSEAMINSKGTIIPFMDIEIKYTKDTGDMDEEGKPELKEVPFIERTDGILFLVAGLDVLKDASQRLQGLVMKSLPFSGNPTDLNKVYRAVYNISELLSRNIS